MTARADVVRLPRFTYFTLRYNTYHDALTSRYNTYHDTLSLRYISDTLSLRYNTYHDTLTIQYISDTHFPKKRSKFFNEKLNHDNNLRENKFV